MSSGRHPLVDAARAGALVLALVACGDPADAPLSPVLTPRFPEAHYVDQANRYFDALDELADPASLPTYGETVARWEWPPWLYLTGFGAQQMKALDEAVKVATPATVINRDCRAFTVQPFARCRVAFRYAEGDCPIYEEFTFNDLGEITFIEAWSDQPGLVPMADPADTWAEGPDVHRLSTRIPGLGASLGQIDLESASLRRAAERDAEVADFVRRAESFWPSWFAAQEAAGDTLFARGCGWPLP